MGSQRTEFLLNVHFILVLLINGLLHTASPCSPSPDRPARSITELAILAPVVIVARVANISVNASSMERLTGSYSACLDVREVIKGSRSLIPQTFCTEQFGTEAMCLADVLPGYSYVFYLNADLKARYDSDFSAAQPASNGVVALARRGYCNSSATNDFTCVPPVITDGPKDMTVVQEGEYRFLTCTASGTKPTVVTWYFKGKPGGMPVAAVVQSDGSLFLKAVSQSHQGRYTCVVQNPAGMTSATTRLVVELKRCGDFMMVNKRSHIQSPNFPGEYPPDKSCAWRFCPPHRSGKRLKFTFSAFNLERHDSIIINNECAKSLEPWRRYCGSQSPGEFVSRCRSGCVQLRLQSNHKYDNYEPFTGINVTVEPTSAKRTPKIAVLQHYCSSDFVLKARLIQYDGWPLNSIKIHALQSYKEPYKQNHNYTVVYSDYDSYGCYHVPNFLKDYYFFGIVKEGILQVKTAVQTESKRGRIVRKKVLKYKDSSCVPPRHRRALQIL